MMNGRPSNRVQPAEEKNVMRRDPAPQAPRIRIDVPLGTPYQEIRNSILRQAWELAGTQLRAAIALGITPETVSRTLRRSKANQDIRPSTDHMPKGDYSATDQGTQKGSADAEPAGESLGLRRDSEQILVGDPNVSNDPMQGNGVCPKDPCSIALMAEGDPHALPHPEGIIELRADEEGAARDNDVDMESKDF